MYKTCLLFVCLSFYAVAVNAQADSVKNEKTIFTKVDEEAAFPGNDAGWRKFIVKNLKPEVPQENGAPSGKYTVKVQFIIKKDGSLSDIRATTKMGYGTEEEVVRIIEKSGVWKPAMINGQPVNAYRIQPVTFLVIDDNITITTSVPDSLFTGIDNEITITAKKVKPGDISATTSNGTIKPIGEGKFIVKPGKPGRVIIEVLNAKKDDKKIGAAIFDVAAPVAAKKD